ncbi:unnamed protein product [Caenorhabditis brenneri]
MKDCANVESCFAETDDSRPLPEAFCRFCFSLVVMVVVCALISFFLAFIILFSYENSSSDPSCWRSLCSDTA